MNKGNIVDSNIKVFTFHSIPCSPPSLRGARLELRAAAVAHRAEDREALDAVHVVGHVEVQEEEQGAEPRAQAVFGRAFWR